MTRTASTPLLKGRQAQLGQATDSWTIHLGKQTKHMGKAGATQGLGGDFAAAAQVVLIQYNLELPERA